MRVVIAGLLAAGLALAGCDGTPDPAASTPDGGSTLPGSGAPSASGDPSGPASTPSDAVVSFDVTVEGGEVRGGGRQRLDAGDHVRIVVTADVSDHVHVHVYDLLADVTPEEPAEIEFVADIPGVVQVELEESQLTLLELEIRG